MHESLRPINKNTLARSVSVTFESINIALAYGTRTSRAESYCLVSMTASDMFPLIHSIGIYIVIKGLMRKYDSEHCFLAIHRSQK